MKNFDLQPTHENLINTYLNDSIKRNEDVISFVKFLNSIDSPCSLALDGKWGSGKTFFIRQTKMVLDAFNIYVNVENPEDRDRIVSHSNMLFGINKPELEPQVCVYYDAWENDNDEDPVLSLVYSILKSAHSDFSFKDYSHFRIAAGLLDFFKGTSFTQLIDCFKSDNPLEGIENSKNIEKIINDFLDSLLVERGNRLVVFIDELDRCKPSYAVRLLERIKHYFCNDRITFVFSVNFLELQSTIKNFYGAEFDASRYLDRFFDLRFSLPKPDINKYYNSIKLDNKQIYETMCEASIKAFNLELREISRFLNMANVAANRYIFGNAYAEADVQFCLLYLLPVMIGLKITDERKYLDFIEGKDFSPWYTVACSLGNKPNTYFGRLLNKNETFVQPASDSFTYVNLSDRLHEVYDAVFNFSKDSMENIYYGIPFGEMRIFEHTKNELIRAGGLFSIYTSIEDAEETKKQS